MVDPNLASATLLAVLAEIFPPSRKSGGNFDHRSIALEVRDHPKLLAAMEFLGVEKATTGWRAGTLSNEGKQRIKQWLDSIEGKALDGRRLERVPFGRYRVARAPRVLTLADLEARPVLADEDGPASEALLAVLADVFWPGRQGGGQFDHRSIASEACKHPRLFAALEFLKVQKSTTGWRAGALSNDSIDRIKQWLAAAEGRELGGRRLDRAALSHYRVALLRHDELPLFC
jgi:hypothetical protein